MVDWLERLGYDAGRRFKLGLGGLAAGNVPCQPAAEKDKAAKLESWDLHFMSCAQDTLCI